MNKIIIYKNNIMEIKTTLNSNIYDLKHIRQCCGINIDGKRCNRKITKNNKGFYRGEHVERIIDLLQNYNPLSVYLCNHHVYKSNIPVFMTNYFIIYAQQFIEKKRKKNILIQHTSLPIELINIIISYI